MKGRQWSCIMTKVTKCFLLRRKGKAHQEQSETAEGDIDHKHQSEVIFKGDKYHLHRKTSFAKSEVEEKEPSIFKTIWSLCT